MLVDSFCENNCNMLSIRQMTSTMFTWDNVDKPGESGDVLGTCWGRLGTCWGKLGTCSNVLVEAGDVLVSFVTC